MCSDLVQAHFARRRAVVLLASVRASVRASMQLVALTDTTMPPNRAAVTAKRADRLALLNDKAKGARQ